jgi:hypothetical protein
MDPSRSARVEAYRAVVVDWREVLAKEQVVPAGVPPLPCRASCRLPADWSHDPAEQNRNFTPRIPSGEYRFAGGIRAPTSQRDLSLQTLNSPSTKDEK